MEKGSQLFFCLIPREREYFKNYFSLVVLQLQIKLQNIGIDSLIITVAIF